MNTILIILKKPSMVVIILPQLKTNESDLVITLQPDTTISENLSQLQQHQVKLLTDMIPSQAFIQRQLQADMSQMRRMNLMNS